MNDLILSAALFYVGGGLACYLLWCVAGLTFYARPASPAARRTTTALRLLGFVHPVAAWTAQDLRHIQAGIDDPTRRVVAPDDGPTPRVVRLDPALGLSTTLMVGSTAALYLGAA